MQKHVNPVCLFCKGHICCSVPVALWERASPLQCRTRGEWWPAEEHYSPNVFAPDHKMGQRTLLSIKCEMPRLFSTIGGLFFDTSSDWIVCGFIWGGILPHWSLFSRLLLSPAYCPTILLSIPGLVMIYICLPLWSKLIRIRLDAGSLPDGGKKRKDDSGAAVLQRVVAPAATVLAWGGGLGKTCHCGRIPARPGCQSVPERGAGKKLLLWRILRKSCWRRRGLRWGKGKRWVGQDETSCWTFYEMQNLCLNIALVTVKVLTSISTPRIFKKIAESIFKLCFLSSRRHLGDLPHLPTPRLFNHPLKRQLS